MKNGSIPEFPGEISTLHVQGIADLVKLRIAEQYCDVCPFASMCEAPCNTFKMVVNGVNAALEMDYPSQSTTPKADKKDCAVRHHSAILFISR